MTFVQYLRILRRQWFVVLLLALLATCGAAAYTERQAPVFESSTQLFVSAGGTQTDISELQTGSTFTQQRVKSYADVVTSPSVAEAVITSLGLTDSPQELASRIAVTNPLDTVLLDISVRDGDPVRAAAIANAVAREFPKFVALLETPAGRVASPVKVSVTQEAAVPDAPVSPRLPLNLREPCWRCCHRWWPARTGADRRGPCPRSSCRKAGSLRSRSPRSASRHPPRRARCANR